MPTPTPRTGLTAVLRRYPALLAGLTLAWAAPLASTTAHAQEREPVYSPDRGSAPAAPNAQEAEWPARVGRIADVQGSARLLDRDDNEWVAATVNRPVTSGDQFATPPGARLEISIGSTTLRVGGDTELVLQRLDDDAVVLQLRRGSLAVQAVSDEMAGQIAVHTAEGRFHPREPGSYRIDHLDHTSHATAWRGTLRFEGRDSLLVIGRGQHAEIWLEGRTTHYRWAEDWRDEFAAWVARDERADARSESARYVSPEMTGWQELDRHGRWETHPEYGAIWTPAVVPAGWAPYRSGHWAWIAPWGWTWIDDARWGFAPFHYGRWVHYNRRWCWVPGHRTVRPVYSPALVAWIGGGRAGIGIGGSVGWVPLGPRDVYHRHRGHDRDRRHDRDRDGWRDRGHDRSADRKPVPAAPRTVPTGPVMYSNQGVPGAVTTVAPDAFAGHRVVPVAGATGGASLRGSPVSAPFTAVGPPPAPPRVVAREPADGGRRTIMPPFGRELTPPAADVGRAPPPAAPMIERTPVPAPERAMAPPRAAPPTPRAADADADHERRRGRVQADGPSPVPGHRGAEGRSEAGRAPFSAPAPAPVPAPPPVAAPPAVAPPAPVLAAPRAAPPRSAPPPAVAPPPRTPADAPRGQGPSREREREEERPGRQRGPEPRENMRERGQVR
ncbi:MAG TPA: DUF6600 domain-containing protein [Aquabacterium sp.]|nr:DUF6600 domain-containing protein [Aquabacterium sp.]